jgi:hypothetical protein
MSNLVYFNDRIPGFHTYGISILTTDKSTAENFMYNEIPTLCEKYNANYFIQGNDIKDHGVSWVFVEFFGEGNPDKILNILLDFNQYYCYSGIYYGDCVLMDDLSRELLESLKLI